MALYNILKLFLIEFRLNFYLKNAFFGQVCIYPWFTSLDDLVYVAFHHGVSDGKLLNFLGLIIEEVDYLGIGSELTDHQDMLVVSMQAFDLIHYMQKMSIYWAGRVF
jgi:hypothetical protein